MKRGTAPSADAKLIDVTDATSNERKEVEARQLWRLAPVAVFVVRSPGLVLNGEERKEVEERTTAD